MVNIDSQASIVSEYDNAPASVHDPLHGCIIGPNYQLVRYTDSAEKANGSLGAYDPTQETCYDWPTLEASAIVDLSYTRLFIDDALLQYFNDPIGSGSDIEAIYCDGTIDLVGNQQVKNALRSSSVRWKTNGAWARSAVFLERDVQVNDVVKVVADIAGTPNTLWTYVAGFMNEEVAGIVGVASEDSNNISSDFEGSSSSDSTVPAITYDKIGYEGVNVDITDAAVVNPDRPEHTYENGVAADVYTLEIVTGGAPGVAVMQISTESGTDEVAAHTISAFAVAQAFGVKGVSVTFTGPADFQVGMKWELDVQWGVADMDVSSAGSYTGLTDLTYVIEVTKGAYFTNSPEITITSSDGTDSSGPTAVSVINTAISVGSYGTTITFSSALSASQGLYLGDKFYITVTAPAAGAVQTLLLGHNLPDSFIELDGSGVCTGTIPDLAVTLYIKKDIEVEEDRDGYAPLVNWVADADEICVEDGVIAYDSTWVNASGVMQPLQVKGGDLYVHYLALRVAGAAQIYWLTPPETRNATTTKAVIKAEFGMNPTTDNPMSMGTYMALLNSGSQQVAYIPIAANTTAGYQAAYDKAADNTSLYTIVPLSLTAAVQAAAKAHVDAYSGTVDGQWRKTYLALDGVEEKSVATVDDVGGILLAKISDDPTEVGTQYTYVEFTNASMDLVVDGVVAGDILRTQYTDDGFGNTLYTEYTIEAVINGNSLRLTSGPAAAIAVAAKAEVWRTLASDAVKDEIVADIIYADQRACFIWPDYVIDDDSNALLGYYVTSALAGLRSTALPNRSLTNVEILGIATVTRTTELFNRSQLETLEAAGVWIVTRDTDGEAYSRRAVTTDTTDNTTFEEVMVTDADSVRYTLDAQVAPYKGTANIVTEVINQLRSEIMQGLSTMQNSTAVLKLGPQILSGTLDSIYQHPVLTNRLVIEVTVALPVPFGELQITLTV